MTLDEANKIAMEARTKALDTVLSELEKADHVLREVYAMAVRRAAVAEYRLDLVSKQNEQLKAQLDEAWAMLAKVTDANPNT